MNYLENFIEWQLWGWNLATISAVGAFLFTGLEAYLFYQQNKIIWEKKSGESLSVDLFIFLPFMFASFIVYGLARHEGVLVFNGLLFLFAIPIAVGLIKFRGYLPRHGIIIILCFLSLLVMVIFPVKELLYFLFAAGSVLVLAAQLWELFKSHKPGAFDIRLALVYLIGNFLWVVYAWQLSDWLLLIVVGFSLVILIAIIFFWLYFKKKEDA